MAAATPFIEEGELEEALTTLGAGTGVEDLEWYMTISFLTHDC